VAAEARHHDPPRQQPLVVAERTDDGGLSPGRRVGDADLDVQEAIRQVVLALLDPVARRALPGPRAAGERERSAEQRRRRAHRLAALALVVGCAHPSGAPRDLIAEAIASRGGPLDGFTRRSDLVVHYGFPGSWQWELSFGRPDRFRLTLRTTGDEQTYTSDGKTLRTYLGSALVTEEPAPHTCFDSLARWLAITHLDEVRSPGTSWIPLPPDALPPGVAHGASVRCAGAPEARFRLFFDRRLRLVGAEGPVSIPTLGVVRLEARFEDFRRVGGLRLAHRIRYSIDGEPFFEETIETIELRGPPPGGPPTPASSGTPGWPPPGRRARRPRSPRPRPTARRSGRP
jgi:hypothetical protein